MTKDAQYYALQIMKCAEKLNREMTHLKLQKILFFMQFFHHKRYLEGKESTPWLFDDDFITFKHGPVVFDIFAKYAGSAKLTLKAPADTVLELSQAQQDDVRRTIKKHPWRLVEISHEPDGAWDVTLNHKITKTISKDLIDQDVKNGRYAELY